MPRSNELASLPWLLLGLGAHGLAATLVLSSVLSSSTEHTPAQARAERAAVTSTPPAELDRSVRVAERAPMDATPAVLNDSLAAADETPDD